MALLIQFPVSPPAWLCEELIAKAKSAANQNEIPIAAGIYQLKKTLSTEIEWQLVNTQINQTIQKKNPLAHCEVLAIDAAKQILNVEYLTDLALVTTLEPCLYCSGAILLSRIAAVYYFAPSTKGIRLTDVLDLSMKRKAKGLIAGVSNHLPEVHQVESHSKPAQQLLSDFFAKQR